MIAGEHQHVDAVEPRRRVALPMREPGDQVLEPAEALRRLGQHVLALGHRGARGGMPARQIEAGGAQVGEGGEGGHGFLALRLSSFARSVSDEASRVGGTELDCFAALLAMTSRCFSRESAAISTML